jgi:hypothetical protein
LDDWSGDDGHLAWTPSDVLPTVIATTGERFSDFAPYVATEGPWGGFHGLPVINESGTVVLRSR